MGILLGIATALSWGSADFLARFATQRIGTFRTMLYMQLIGFLLLTLLMPQLGGWGHLADGSGIEPWAWGILAGLLNTAATLSLYRSFEIGKMSVVAPVSSSYPALTTVLSLTTGEHLTLARVAGILLTVVGVVLVARGESSPADANVLDEQRHPRKKYLGVGWAICAAVGFGVMFWLLGIRVIPRTGATQAVWLIRLISVAATAATIFVLRQSAAVPGKRATSFVLGIGVLDTGAYVLNNTGMRFEQVSVVSVLSSMYGAVTVLLAALILREPISRMQGIGLAAIFGGIFFLSR